MGDAAHAGYRLARRRRSRENGVEGLTDMLLCVDDPAAVARATAAMSGARRSCAAGCTPRARRGGLVFADAARTAKMLPDFRAPSLPFMAGQALRADLSSTRAALSEGTASSRCLKRAT